MIYSRNILYTDCSNYTELYNWMKKNIKYSEYTRLKSAKEVFDSKSGSCHDQVMFELHELRALGLKPKALFIIEYNDNNGGGMTHSFVYFNDGDNLIWFENAWKSYSGLHKFKSLDDMKEFIINKHNSGTFGNKRKYPNIDISNFGKHIPGETLQEFIDKV